MDIELRIGEVSKQADVSVDTVRYYERRGLLPAAPRTASGYRVFTAEAIERVLFIKQAQELGFSLKEIDVLVGTNGHSECRSVYELLSSKLEDIDSRLKRMRQFRQTIKHYLSECEEALSRPGKSDCPVVDEISHINRSSKQ